MWILEGMLTIVGVFIALALVGAVAALGAGVVALLKEEDDVHN